MIIKIRCIMDKQISKIKNIGYTYSLILLLMVLASFILSFIIFKGIFTYEFNHAYNADDPLYWTVGRGILNGLMPYQEMYENKPIGIFVISALSFAFTNGTVLCNVISFISAFLHTIIPLWIISYELNRTENDGTYSIKKAVVILIVFMSSLLLTIYCELRSGGFQVEMIASVFSILFICLTIRLKNAKTRRQTIFFSAFSAVSISCTVMMKEPFLLVSLFGALLFIDTFRELLKCIVIPCIIGAIFTLFVLAISGLIVPYFSIYVKQMFLTRLSGESSALTRSFDILKLSDDLKRFSMWFLILMLVFIISTMLWPICKKQNLGRAVFHLLKVAAAIYISSFCVGMGGQYYIHHYVFAVPVYFSFIVFGGKVLFELKYKNKPLKLVLPALCGISVITVCLNIGIKYTEEDYNKKFNTIQADAEYIDEMLDFYGEKRYQFIGFNGEYVCYGLTKHSPLGPVFVQDPDNMKTLDSWFTINFLNQIEESNIVVLDYFDDTIMVNDYVENKLYTEFTDDPAIKFEKNPPDEFDYEIYFRISKYGQNSEKNTDKTVAEK